MNDLAPGFGNPDAEDLRNEVRKLRKINAALMDRVERSSDMAGNAFSMFETAISLEAMVRERTMELEDALRRLAKANADLAEAHAAADANRMRLRDAIDSINEGFVLFDAEDRLVLFNEAYLGFWPEIADQVREGMSFDQIAKLAASHNQPRGTLVGRDRWVSDRLARHSVADGGHVQALADGRWVQINELRTSEGGIVGIYTDITEAKAEDARERARELAERNIVLQSTLDNLSEGVCLFDAQGRLAAWNEALQRLLTLPEDWSMGLATHQALIGWCRETLGMEDDGCLDWRGESLCGERVHRLVRCGARSFEVRSNAMEQGGQVIGFTDVTDMLRAQSALRETAESLERRVAERTGELVAVNHQLAAEVAERREIEAQLMDAKTAAEKANLSKTSFLAAASHDLLQPLNAARLFVAALGDRRLALPTRALVSQTSTALDSVEDLLEALLEISRLDAGAIQPEISDFRLDRMLEALRVEFAPMARSSGLTLSFEAEPVWVRSDIRLLRRILQNFLSNALRYTQRGSVTLRCLESATGVRVSVSDTGPGIAADKQPLIFEEFRRFDNRQGGKGLGLAIVRRASVMLGHAVTVESTPGQGSTFSIDLPRGAVVMDEAAQTDGPGRDRGMRGLKVLIVDNEKSIQSGMRTLLEGWGCAVSTATGFDDAAPRFPDGTAPDVMLVDYHLNDGETGDVAIRRLNDHFGDAVPAIIISADRGEPLKMLLDERGIPVLNKPVKPAQLRALLRTMVR
ncbi:signal transduction histidine kinase/CheY-like chemotaxis protein/cellobiose-specific phosphotransferase system component IIA [Sphingobium sp. OAS761]|uniref:NahK/ErcS family hybrid sensor histidine kinase/response regulator n=1 Tax=Sphingobium sp. OAS761 TaxID=2817901 RepID=UPI00209F5BDC|nr:NahK/ErcS family hybrid sensor histidine kinase/response regulator [Sphingobium sp. OAS761]MCP1469739.1 signal transduction histidine kinase/CheY-like chemotaxis protein/cellobiose-specific phosphotransferase system component IIA [Sphingobium sp. OAS761]